MLEIALTKGKSTIVNDDDYEWLTQWKWCFGGDGYAVRSIPTGKKKPRQRFVYMHRIILGSPVDMKVDHKDGDKLNNTRSNLRIATNAQNIQNQKPRKNTLSKYKGVSWHKLNNRWCAIIQCNKKSIWLGYFLYEQDAAKAYNEAAKKLHGEFAKLNEILHVA